MAATVTASISALILTLDDPGRDDLDSITVWGSTTSGFTPSNANVLYKGKSLSVTIANLVPLTTYYLRYAYISQIDPSDYVISAELSGVPNKIDGGLIVDNLRGKTLAGGVVIDGGTVTTAAVAIPANVTVTTTVPVESTEDFHDFGAAIVLSKSARFREERQFRYTGKTATSFTGVSGLLFSIEAGDIIIPQPFPSFSLDSYVVGDPIDTSNGANFLFRNGGGVALAINGGRITDSFTYTAGQTLSGGVYSSVLSGVSGLAAFSAGQGSRATIVDVYYLAYTTIATTGTFTTLTINAPISYLKSGGGKCLLVSWNVSGIKKVTYASVSGTTVTLNSSVTLSAGTYWFLPLYSFNVVGADLYSTINYNNAYNGEWQKSFVSSDIEVSTSLSDGIEIMPSVGYGLKIWPSARASEYDGPGMLIGTPGGALHMELQPISFSQIDTSWMYSVFGFSLLLGAAKGLGSYANYVLVAYDGASLLQYQPISTTLRFSGYNAADLDAITFDDATNTYTFSADGGSGNATIVAANVDVGTGSAGSPAIGPSSDTNTGEFFPAADTIAWSTGGSERFRVRSDGNFAIGGTGLATANLAVTKNITGGTPAYGALISGAVLSDVTNAAYFVATYAATAAASFTLPSLIHYLANQGTFGSGSSVTNQYGFYSNTVLIDATWNIAYFAANTAAVGAGKTAYGFYSNINIATGGGTTYGFYAAGTAQNYFGGYTRVSVTDNTNPALKVTQAGTADGLSVDGVAVFGSGNPVGQNLNGSGGTPRAQVHGVNNIFANGAIAAANWGANVRGGGIFLATSRGGSVGSYAAAVADDFMGEIRFAGSDGAAMQQGAIIAALVDGTPAAGSMPGRISFQTSPSGSANPVQRAMIDSAGNMVVTGPGGLGYGTGSGGAVTQATSRTTGVTLNKTNGAITLLSAAGSTAWQSFTVTNSTVAATDTVIVNQKSGTDLYECHVTAVAAGSFRISYRTTAGTTTEQPVFNFSVIKAVAA